MQGFFEELLARGSGVVFSKHPTCVGPRRCLCSYRNTQFHACMKKMTWYGIATAQSRDQHKQGGPQVSIIVLGTWMNVWVDFTWLQPVHSHILVPLSAPSLAYHRWHCGRCGATAQADTSAPCLPEVPILGTPAQHTQQAYYAGRSVTLERGGLSPERACHLSMLGFIKLRVVEERWGQLDLVVSDGSSRALRAMRWMN